MYVVLPDPQIQVQLSDILVIPLTSLLQTSKILVPLCLWGSETSIVKAVRAQAAASLEVRLLVSEPSTSAWFNASETAAEVGGYEIRRKDWETTREHLSRRQWEERTIYLVRQIYVVVISCICNYLNRKISQYNSGLSQGLLSLLLRYCRKIR